MRTLLTSCFIAGAFALTGIAADPHSNRDSWTFVSIPDFLNQDIGDVRFAPGWDGGRNSINDYHREAIGYVVNQLYNEHPDFVLVAGDLVNGHWDRDSSERKIFGPVDTYEQKAQAIRTAADLYYTQWKARFEQYGLPVHAATGDHELGDNNWNPGSDKARLVPVWREMFSKHFMQNRDGSPRYHNRPAGSRYAGTAYATQHKNVLIVSVDVFRMEDPQERLGRTGAVVSAVEGRQLEWLDQVLAEANDNPAIDHIIVQGHTPVLAPVRKQNSSGLTMPGGKDTPFWQALVEHNVDLYLCGEVHHMTASNHGGVEQLAHGGIMGYAPNSSYLVANVLRDKLELELKWIDMMYTPGDNERLWQAKPNRPHAHYSLDIIEGFKTAGTLTIDKSSGETVYENRSGFFNWHGTHPEE